MKGVLLLFFIAMVHFCGSSRNPDQVDTSPNSDGSIQNSSNVASRQNGTSNNVPSPVPKIELMERVVSFPQPEYPAAARAIRASGSVGVQVYIAKNGKVVSATPISGHPLLRKSAMAAALKAEFRPLLIYGEPKSESAVITYNFEL